MLLTPGFDVALENLQPMSPFPIFTARVRSMTARYYFHRCLSVHTWGGYIQSPSHNTFNHWSHVLSRGYPYDWSKVPSQGVPQWLVPSPFPGGTPWHFQPMVPCPFQGVPQWMVPGPFLGGTPVTGPSQGYPPGLGYHTAKTEVPPGQDWGTTLTRTGVPPPQVGLGYPSSTGQVTLGQVMPREVRLLWFFPQEDFLVRLLWFFPQEDFLVALESKTAQFGNSLFFFGRGVWPNFCCWCAF